MEFIGNVFKYNNYFCEKMSIMHKKYPRFLCVWIGFFNLISEAKYGKMVINKENGGESMVRLPSRQVHLDFHTSELIKGIGSRFSKEDFKAALQTGRLNSITIFAKCHHSMCYYPTKVGTMHPGLDFDLLGAQIEAAHEIGVRAPIYITAGWSSVDAEQHPEWLSRNKDGVPFVNNYDLEAKPEDKKPIVSWKRMCINGPYGEHILALTKEICDLYPVDGLFYDIMFVDTVCYCNSCVKGMKAAGLNPEDEADARKYFIQKRQEFCKACAEILKEKHPDGTLFFNGGAEISRPEYHALHTHFEMEDLPTTWGGYDKMPPRAKYFARTGLDYLGMTGKFHTMWGEFGGFKNPEALRFEVAAMMTYGARCSVGDQAHPDGEMDLETYRTIGHAYRYLESLEEYCYDTSETTRLGLYLSRSAASDEGAVKALLEHQLDFDIVLDDDDFSRFDTIVFPDCVKPSKMLCDKLSAYLQGGGKALITGTSLLDESAGQFAVDFGVQYKGKSEFDNDYVVVGEELSNSMVTSPFLFYTSANKVQCQEGKVLAEIKEPYFNRTYAHYCSHQNTPFERKSAFYPAAVKKENVVYLAHEIFSMYHRNGCQYHRDYAVNALNLLYTDPVLRVSLMSAGRARLARQDAQDRYCLHLLYGSPVQRGRTSVIEDLPPVYNTKVEFKSKEKIKKIHIPFTGQSLDFEQKGDRVCLTVPEFSCHCLVVAEYEK